MTDIPRRGFLGGLAGAAGGSTFTTSATAPDGKVTDADDAERSVGPTSADGTSLSSGPTTPTYPYRETGVEPLRPEPGPENPALEADDVLDGDAAFVADPFVFVSGDGVWHMFFEVVFDHGVVAHAVSLDHGRSWTYDQVVLERPYHMSFPYVFKWRGDHYMLPAEVTSKVRLYRATTFPTEWEEAAVLFDSASLGPNVNDSVPFRWNDRWWLLAGGGTNDLHAFHARELTGQWTPHENNPVVENRPHGARPAGRPVVRDDHVLVPFQDVRPFYGAKVRAFRIDELTRTSYVDSELAQSPILEAVDGSDAWNSLRMHHFDPWYLGDGEGWRVAVDGDSGDGWAIGVYDVPER